MTAPATIAEKHAGRVLAAGMVLLQNVGRAAELACHDDQRFAVRFERLSTFGSPQIMLQ
jgi:hypothetical protein